MPTSADRMDSPSVMLILDDDMSFCDALSRAMNRNGFEVHSAQNISTAMQLAVDHTPGFAIVDLRIGLESGLDAVKQLLDRIADIRIVVLTGFASIATAVEAIKLGAIHYLTKPAHPDEIVAAFFKEEGSIAAESPTEPMSVRRLEWEHLHKVLQQHDGNVTAAARALNMHRRTLQRKLQKYPARR